MPASSSPPPGYLPLPGSEQPALPATGTAPSAPEPAAVATDRAPQDPTEPIELTVVLRARHAPELDAAAAAMMEFPAPSPPATAAATPDHLTPADFAAHYGADPADLAAVTAFTRAHGLDVREENAARRRVVLAGSAAQVARAFAVDFTRVAATSAGGASVPASAARSYRHCPGPVHLPAHLIESVVAVLGLDERPQARIHFRRLGGAQAQAARQTRTSFTPLELGRLYAFPTRESGRGETIGIIELGGGYTPADLATYFAALGVAPAPTVASVSVDGGRNAPTGDPNGADGEVELDIEVAGALAPGARLKVFFAPNTDRGFLDAITAAVHDPEVTLLSISWGQAESGFAAQSRTAFNQAFRDAAMLGKTVFAAAGDNGSSDGVTDGRNHVDFPSSSPWVVACGGTRLSASANRTSIVAETVWNEQAQGQGATGGGVSDYFARPTYQANANVPAPTRTGGGRGLPDVSADADPATGYQVRVDGADSVIGGTSAVAPLLAALFARLNEALRAAGRARVGFVHPRLYALPQAFRDVTTGNNGAFAAGPGWDAATGLGSPRGEALRQALLAAG